LEEISIVLASTKTVLFVIGQFDDTIAVAMTAKVRRQALVSLQSDGLRSPPVSDSEVE